MQVLSTDHYMLNAEVLEWTQRKRKQHEREDTEDRAKGLTLPHRPKNFTEALEKHERHLKSDAYPYAKNPSAYEGKNADLSLKMFSDATMDKIQVPVFERFKERLRNKELTVKQAQDEMEIEHEKKELSETEMLMIHNHAPMCVEMLQPMIENVDERFTAEELEILVECVKEVYRVDEVEVKEAKVTGAEVSDVAEQPG